MTPADKITKAKIQLILSQPFFATLLMSIGIQEDTTIKKAATNGEAIKYHPEYINGLQVDEIKGLLCSGIMKIANLHHLRRNGRDNDTWQKASELSVNTMIEDSGLTLPKDSLIDKQYKDLAAEQIFSLLPAPPPQQQPASGQPDPNGNESGQGQDNQQPGNDNNGPMEVQDGSQKTQTERDEQAAKIKQKVAQAAQIAKKAGKMPGDIARMVEELLTPQVNWKEVLARFIMDTARNDYSFKKPNPRFIQSGFYLPSLYNEEPGNIVFIVDTSASIDKKLFEQFAGELQDVCNTLKSGLICIYVDTEVQGVQEIEPDENVILQAKGGGGTSFAPGFNYIDDHGLTPKAVVYLTDGMSDDYPEEEPDTPVLWAKYGNYNFKPPFGEVINVK